MSLLLEGQRLVKINLESCLEIWQIANHCSTLYSMMAMVIGRRFEKTLPESQSFSRESVTNETTVLILGC